LFGSITLSVSRTIELHVKLEVGYLGHNDLTSIGIAGVIGGIGVPPRRILRRGPVVTTTAIWILEPRTDLPENDDPWKPWFNRCFGMAVEASAEQEAREIAHEKCVCCDQTILRDRRVFLDSRYTTCVELRPTGQSRLILADYRMS
jgi:hypothetical protein